MGQREDQYRASVKIDDTDYGTWDRVSGGEKDSEEAKFHPGGMAPAVSLGGIATVGNVTVGRLFDATAQGWIHTLMDKVGVGKVTVTKQPLDVNKNPYGKPLVYTGMLKQVTPPDHDSESSDASILEIEVSSATVS